MIRKDLPLGTLAAQLVHAAGESANVPGGIPSGTHAIVLAAKNEAQLRRIAWKLTKRNIPHHLICEPDSPHNGAAMAIGVSPVRDRKSLRKALSNLPLLSEPKEG